jgi:hypothetical protein
LPVCGLVLMFVVDVYVERILRKSVSKREKKVKKKEKTDKFSFDGFPFCLLLTLAPSISLIIPKMMKKFCERIQTFRQKRWKVGEYFWSPGLSLIHLSVRFN